MAPSPPSPVPMRRVLKRWWPLAASWMLMAVELPAVSAVVARLADPDINLAAYGGVVFPLSLIIESPIIMLLAASTALSKDWASYLKLRRFMMWAGGALTALHLAIAVTPLYYAVVEGIMGAPTAIVEPARIGLLIMTPWTWSIAYRRFHQGVLIRYDQAPVVTQGTLCRLGALGGVLAVGYAVGTWPGIVVGPSAVAAGVLAEAAFIGWRVRPVLSRRLYPEPPMETPLSYREFAKFYVPLSLTSLLNLMINPLGSAMIARMPEALMSLAVWPVIQGLMFLLRSLGFAYQEVVVALLDEAGSAFTLRRFTIGLSAILTVVMALIAATPLSTLWFDTVSGLRPELAALGRSALWVGLLMPAISVWQNALQGLIVHSRRTRGVSEAVAIFLISAGAVLGVGVAQGTVTGIYIGVGAFVVGGLIQVGWLLWRGRSAWGTVATRDGGPSAASGQVASGPD